MTDGGCAPQAGVMFLFKSGRRPHQDTIAQLVQQGARARISLLPSDRGSEGADWLELLAQGLTFDCLGLAPGPALAQPEWHHRLGLNGASDTNAPAAEAVGLFAGPHIEAAARSLVVLRAQLGIARDFAAGLPDISAVGWTPARVLLAPDAFVAAIDAWLGGQAFPSLALVGFRADPSGAVVSEGLSFFTGQELRVEADTAESPLAAVQLGARLIHELVAAEPLIAPQDFVSPSGAALSLVPDARGQVIAVVQR